MSVRAAFLILVLMVTAAARIHLERQARFARYQAQHLALETAALRRELGNQQLQLADLTRPRVVRSRVDAMALNLVDTTERRPRLAAIPYYDGQSRNPR